MSNDSPPPTTLEEAEQVNPFTLAAMWGQRDWQDEPLAELAVSSALAVWLERWKGLQIHRAARYSGAGLGDICEATGMNAMEVRGVWSQWAQRQRRLELRGKPSLSADEYAQAERVLFGGER